MDQPSDEQLMLRIAGGDESAFRTLARRCVPSIIGLARRMLGNSADAEEVAQEAMLRVWINAPRWRPEARFRTWLYRVVVNLCLNRKRRAPFADLESIGEVADLRPDAVTQLEREQRDKAIAAAIARLPERQRAATVLTFHEGLSNAEAAVVLGTTRSAVETLLVRAKKSLRRQLGPMGENISGE